MRGRPGGRAVGSRGADGQQAPPSHPTPRRSSAGPSRARAGPSPPASPPHGSQKGLCCHGNTCPIILLAENHLSANLVGTHPFYRAKPPPGFLPPSEPELGVKKRRSRPGDSGCERGLRVGDGRGGGEKRAPQQTAGGSLTSEGPVGAPEGTKGEQRRDGQRRFHSPQPTLSQALLGTGHVEMCPLYLRWGAPSQRGGGP